MAARAEADLYAEASNPTAQGLSVSGNGSGPTSKAGQKQPPLELARLPPPDIQVSEQIPKKERFDKVASFKCIDLASCTPV